MVALFFGLAKIIVLGGPDGVVVVGRRLGERQVKVEVQDHDNALVVGQALERRRQDLSVRHDHGEVGIDDGMTVGLHVQLDHVPAP